MDSEKFKKALRIAVNVGCGFEGDAEDAASLLGLIVANESRIAELEAEIDQLIEAGEAEDSPMSAEWLVLVKDWKEREK